MSSELQKILKVYHLEEMYHVTPLDDVGYVVARKNKKENKNITVAFDFDDTIYATSLELVFSGTHLIPNIVESMHQVSHQAEAVIFTKGDPLLQLSKILWTIASNRKLAVNLILLAKESKGEVLQKLQFSDSKSVFVLFDNNPEDLESVKKAGKTIGLRTSCVRFNMPGVFKEKDSWTPDKFDDEVIFSSIDKGPSPEEISQILLTCAKRAQSNQIITNFL